MYYELLISQNNILNDAILTTVNSFKNTYLSVVIIKNKLEVYFPINLRTKYSNKAC